MPARALALSIALHLAVALFLPVWTIRESAGVFPVEAISFARIARMHIERPTPARLATAAPVTRNLAKRITVARMHAELSAKSRRLTNAPNVSNPMGEAVAAAPKNEPLPRSAKAIAPPQHVVSPDSTVASNADRTPNPSSSTDARAVSSSGNADRGGVMPMGEYNPPILDPAVRDQLAKMARTHVTLIVVVGEDGKTKSVKFDPPLDDQTENAMRSLLASASWDAAVCGGGVSCEGTATIRL